jgi:hypothetical protein
MAAKSIESIWIVLGPWTYSAINAYSLEDLALRREASDDEALRQQVASVDALLPPETL